VPKCQLCPADFIPRAPKLKVCIRCEAYLTLCSLKSEAVCEPQRALPFLLFPARRRRKRAGSVHLFTDSRSRRAAGTGDS